MLKVQRGNGNYDYQRRPTRFSSSFEPSSSQVSSSHQDLLQNKSTKCSTITKIPLAPQHKNSIRPPVERSSTTNLNNTNNNNNNIAIPATTRSRLAKTQPRALSRPSSLSLAGGREISSSTSRLTTNGSSRVGGASVLQRISDRTVASKANIRRRQDESSDNKLKINKCEEDGDGNDDRGSKGPAGGCLQSSRQQLAAQRRQIANGNNKQGE